MVKVFSWGSFPPLANDIVEGSDTTPPYVLTGIVAISLSRSKNSPAGSANIVIRGDTSNSPIRIGDWAIVYSIHDIAPNQVNTQPNNIYANASPNGVPRFFGQIRSVKNNYKRDSNGTLHRTTFISVSEWSHFFSVPVRYDTFSLINQISDPRAQIAQTVNFRSKLPTSSNPLLDIATSQWSAFATVHIILRLIAAISGDDTISSVKDLDINLPEVALRLPTVPPSIPKALQVTGDPSNPFSSDMLTVITGVLKQGLHNDGEWNGVFENQEFSSLPSNSFLIDQDPTDRPKTIGLNPMFTQGFSAWSLLQNHGDTDINEIFTDIAYEYSTDGKEIIAKPFLWVRDKPFALKSVYSTKDNQGGWTMFDDIPRIRISEEYIMEASFSLDADNAANYIRFNFNGQEIGDPQVLKTASEQAGVNNRQAEQERFGGKELFLNTSWIAGDPGQKGPSNIGISALDTTNTPAWYAKLKSVVDCWYGNLYRTASGSLFLKDHNVALTLGMNLQFSIGGVMLVGHIESVSMSFHIDPNGHRATDYQVDLSHIVTVTGSGDLDYLDPDTFRTLRHS